MTNHPRRAAFVLGTASIAFALLPPAHPALAAQATTSPMAPPSAALLDGTWTGGMTVPAGLTIPFSLRIAGSGGSFAAPDQNIKDVPIAVANDAGRVVVTLHGGKSRFEGTLRSDGTLRGEWIQGETRFPASFVRGTSAVEVRRPQTPMDPFPYASRDVTFPAGAPDVELAGTLTTPKSDRPVAAVLLIGGNGPQNRDEAYAGHRPFLVIADRLTRAGVAVLRYDKRGVGASGGAYSSARGEDFVEDAAAALAWLRRQPGVDPARVGLLGISEGAEIAPIVAGRRPEPAFVVLLSPPGVRGDRLMAEQARLASLAAGGTRREAAREAALRLRLFSILESSGGDRTAAQRAMEDAALAAGRTPAAAKVLAGELAAPDATTFLTHDPAASLARLRQPVLVLAGSVDRQVPPSLNLPSIRAALAQDRRSRIVEISGLNHLLQPARTGLPDEYGKIDVTMDERALDLLERFVGER